MTGVGEGVGRLTAREDLALPLRYVGLLLSVLNLSKTMVRDTERKREWVVDVHLKKLRFCSPNSDIGEFAPLVNCTRFSQPNQSDNRAKGVKA